MIKICQLREREGPHPCHYKELRDNVEMGAVGSDSDLQRRTSSHPGPGPARAREGDLRSDLAGASGVSGILTSASKHRGQGAVGRRARMIHFLVSSIIFIFAHWYVEFTLPFWPCVSFIFLY